MRFNFAREVHQLAEEIVLHSDVWAWSTHVQKLSQATDVTSTGPVLFITGLMRRKKSSVPDIMACHTHFILHSWVDWAVEIGFMHVELQQI